MKYISTKVLDLGSCAFRQWKADHSHCKFVHGYKLQAKFWFGCSSLDNKNWVVDFGGLKELKAALEKQFDHTLCIAADDPCLPAFQALHDKGAVDLRVMDKGVGIERTAEWCLDTANSIIKKQTNNRCWVIKVEVWEHDKNSALAIFENPVQQTIVTTVTTPVVEIQEVVSHNTTGNSEQPASANSPRPAVVGNKVTPGLSNPFGGTSWGL